MTDWQEDVLPAVEPDFVGWVRVLWRGAIFGGLIYVCLSILLLVRLIERPLFGMARPWTPHITQFVCRMAFPILGLRLDIEGAPMAQRGAVVSNHMSWLDIFALNAAQRIYFVAKSEVEHWAAIGWLARATGTVFVARKGSAAKVQQGVFEERLRAGHRLLFFPEGTSTDGVRVLPFKSTLFAAFYTHGLDHILHVQPVTVTYHAPEGQDPRFYGWWGDMSFSAHLMKVLVVPRQGWVRVVFHKPLPVDGFPDRKALAAECERVIRAEHDAALR